MKQPMKSRGAWLSPEGHAALVAKARGMGVDLAVVVRSLLEQYVAGHLTIESQLGGVQSRFCAPPELMKAAEEKGRSQGYTYGLLVGRLVDKALVQNPQGETHEN